MREDFVSKVIRVGIASDQEHEHVVAEIYWGDKFVALVSQDSDFPIVEFPGPGLDEACISRVIPLKTLLEALELATRRLKE
jgi:hypothetical protein